jgi:hypothetical protein
MRCPGLPGLPVQESWSVKMMIMSNSLLEEKKSKEKRFLEFVSLSDWEVLFCILKTCAGGWGYVPCKYCVVVVLFSNRSP